MPDVKFIEGEPPEQSGPGSSKVQPILVVLSEHPNQWAEVYRLPIIKRPAMSNRRQGFLKRAKELGVAVEAVNRKDGDDIVMYARVVK